MGFFAKLFRRPSRKVSKQTRIMARMQLEELMPRVLPSATPFAAALGGARSDFAASAHAPAAAHDGGGCHGEVHGAVFTATLANATGATGHAAYDPVSGKLVVEVKGAAASSSLDVQIDGTSVGTLQTGTSGNGRATLTVDTTKVTVKSGSAITIGDLTGTLNQVQ